MELQDLDMGTRIMSYTDENLESIMDRPANEDEITGRILARAALIRAARSFTVKGRTMKALTVREPWATLIARGIKAIENRSWPTDYRGPLAIHAAKTPPTFLREDLEALEEMGVTPADMTYGAVIAVAELVDCIPIHKAPAELRNDQFAEGPFLWILKDVRRLDTPIPWKGALGLWTIDHELLKGTS
jgi:activating signal cointegrator 1